jgi:GDP-L-fucose synthase
MKNNFNAKIYIPGHLGLVGSAILKNLINKGYKNFLLLAEGELDLRRQNEVEDLFAKEKPDYVILAAAKVGGIVANNTYKAEFIYDNLMIAANIINSAYKIGVKKLLNLGSSCIYPKLANQPLKEEYLLTGELEQTNEPYAIAKISAIKLCRYYNEQYGTNYISVMPTNLYGQNDNFNLETSHVLPALIRKMLLAKALSDGNNDFLNKDISKYRLGFGLDSEINLMNPISIKATLEKIGISDNYIKIWGTGNVYREFLHVEDMADACVFLMESYSYSEIGEFINIGTGKDLTIKDLVNLVKEIIGFKGEIQFDISKPEGTPKKLLDVSRLNKLGWSPKIELRQGIEMIVNNYNSKY